MATAARPGRLPPVSFFLVSAVFHYLGPALAVLLFAHVAALGVMWLRIATAAVVFAVWRRPWRLARRLSRRQQARLALLGGVLAGMNTLFYLAIARLPLATVGAIEFLGTIALAAAGARTRRNAAALALTVGGVALLTVIQLGAGVGICSSVIPYVTDQLAMAALPRASFALVIAGVAIHRPAMRAAAVAPHGQRGTGRTGA
jgi:threonine/homoserine efflux transporter RhtA